MRNMKFIAAFVCLLLVLPLSLEVQAQSPNQGGPDRAAFRSLGTPGTGHACRGRAGD